MTTLTRLSVVGRVKYLLTSTLGGVILVTLRVVVRLEPAAGRMLSDPLEPFGVVVLSLGVCRSYNRTFKG